MSVLITMFNAKPHLQAVMKAYMRVLKNLHDIVLQYSIYLPQPHHIFFTFQYALMYISSKMCQMSISNLTAIPGDFIVFLRLSTLSSPA